MTATDVDFKLRDLVRQVRAEFDSADPVEIARKVAAAVPESSLREALEQALPLLVREVMQEHRPRGQLGRLTPATPMPTFQAPAPRPSPPPTTRTVRGPGAPTPQYSGSRKGSEIREAWQRTLDATYATESGQKRLGSLTYEDLYFVARGLDKQAEQHQERARGMRSLAALLLDDDKADVLDELPAAVLMQALGSK